MQGMIFAAGLGTRLKPWTDSHPKALVPVGGIPVLGRALTAMRSAGIDHVVVNVHHFARQVRDYLAANQDFGLTVRISDETDLLRDTGGGLLHARSLFLPDLPILLYNADVVTDMPLDAVELRGDATLLCSHRESSRSLVFNPQGRLCGWRDGRSGAVRGRVGDEDTLLSFNGIHVVSPGLFEPLAQYGKDVFSLTPFYVDMADRLHITAQLMDRWQWFDIGRPETLMRAQQWADSAR